MSARTGRRALPSMLLAVLAAGALAGCVSGLHSNEPAPQSYLLDPGPAAVAPDVTALPDAPAPRQSLQVLAPSAAPGLAGDAIAVLRSGARLDYYRGARWAADATAMLQGLTIDALRPAGRFALVEADGGPFAADYVLGLELRHFEAQYRDDGPPTVHVTLIASFGRRNAGEPATSVIADSEVRAQDNRMQAVVAAFGQATGEALRKVVAAVAALPPDR
ncbi:MAG TPA: ABC-type transport auxiliary lipoprotein family protein [Steroidobacteraceae bacterium]|nr:ABC-type transport auxiliary lipoprotein family protein [Steroidobacteraceae bacterium]